jgi:glycosyltransferase involved in cell wall biosynthesis
MKKVLMIGWELPPFNSGGLGIACYYLALALSKKVDLFFSLPYQLNINLAHFPFKIIFANSVVKKISSYQLLNFPISSELFDQVITYGERLHQKIKDLDLNFDLIHAHDWLGSLAGIYLKEKLHKPLIIHIHSTEIERTGNNPNLTIYYLEKKSFETADRLIAVSNLTKKIVANFYGIDQNKIETVPNGIDYEIPQYKIIKFIQDLKNRNYKIVLFVGRLVLQKGPDYLLRTLKYVSQYIPKVKYIFAGSGEMINDLIKIAYYDQVIDKVIFAGFLREEELWSVYALSDILVAPSVFDPFGLVPLEGVKFKKPVIISKTTGVGEYLNNCFKVDYWDINAMVNYIVGLLNYNVLKKEMAENAYQELPKFNWEDRAENLLKIYNNLV